MYVAVYVVYVVGSAPGKIVGRLYILTNQIGAAIDNLIMGVAQFFFW